MSFARLAALALLVTSASASAFACGGRDAAWPEAVEPSAPRFDEPTASRPRRPAPGLAERRDAGALLQGPGDAAPPPRPRRPPRIAVEPEYGTVESPKPGDGHAFRLAAALRAMRASPSGAKIVKMMSAFPDVIDATARTGVEPFADAEWLLVYGSRAAVPGPNANVIKHARPEATVAKAVADGGFEAWDAGAPVSLGAAGALRGEAYGVRDVLLRPQPGVLALVPGDRARDLAAALARPIESGVRPGELARVFVDAPSTLTRVVPSDVLHATVVLKAAPDGGLDARAEAECPDAASCKVTAKSLEELAKRSNSLMVRLVTRNLLGGLTVRADHAKVRATLHAAPEQVDSLVSLLRAQFGLPAVDPGTQTHRP